MEFETGSRGARLATCLATRRLARSRYTQCYSQGSSSDAATRCLRSKLLVRGSGKWETKAHVCVSYFRRQDRPTCSFVSTLLISFCFFLLFKRNILNRTVDEFFTHATLCWPRPSAVLAVATCMCIGLCVHLSIRESVTRRSSVETDGPIELGFLAWRLPLTSPKLCFCVISKIHYARSFCK